MKTIHFAICSASLLLSVSSFADFTNGAMTCQSSSVTVSLNSDRTEFTVTPENGTPTTFDVTDVNAVGDSQTYQGQMKNAHFKDTADVTLSDSGASLTQSGQTTQLSCY
jgi:hypothetical protein